MGPFVVIIDGILVGTFVRFIDRGTVEGLVDGITMGIFVGSIDRVRVRVVDGTMLRFIFGFLVNVGDEVG